MSEQGLGHYVYGIVDGGESLSFEGLPGVDPTFEVRLLRHRGLAAIVSEVRLAEFGADALSENLEDLAWLERTARAHDAVLGRALDAGGLVPLRLCTVFTGESHVREMIEREQEVLHEVLTRLRGHAEWSVKVLADFKALQDAEDAAPAGEGADASADSPGRAYFARKKESRSRATQARAVVEGAVQEVHSRLRELAAATTLLRPQNPELSRRSGEMVHNGAYLVDRSRDQEFVAMTEELASVHRARGLTLECSGPWAPYNFVGGAELLSTGVQEGR